ncbi:hypothetical protein BMETH_1783_0 [methanotrophic bacterial endosymbiont of Bathymodiolus sp.]|nr:hypothetical protein BMETH_1783_0 [methanotrophic bacterial endosymbiont of Bathymodiolus sp.]
MIQPSCSAYSIRPNWVKPRFPPSATILHRNCPPLMRKESLTRSPTSLFNSTPALI